MPRPDALHLLQHAIKEHNFFDPRGLPIHTASAPARLDVLGGLGAYVGGTVAQMTLPLRAAAAAQVQQNPELTIHSCDPSTTAALPALWQALRAAHPSQLQTGAKLMLEWQIAPFAGQAAATALLTAALLALAAAFGLPLTPSQVASYVQQATTLTAAARIDATTCLLAENPRRPCLLRYSAQPCEFLGHVPLPDNIRILALDTGVRKSASPIMLDELRIAGAMGLAIIETIYRDLGQRHTPLHGYLANTSPLLYRQYFRALLPKRLRGSDFQRTFGPLPPPLEAALETALDPAGLYRVRTAVDHFIAEHEHAEQFLQAMEELSEKNPNGQPAMGDPEERQRTLQRAGRLALASHHSYRLRLEFSCREADWLVDHLMESGPDKGIYGARITSAGLGGTVMALVDNSPAAGDAILEIIKTYPQATGRTLAVFEAGAPGSAGGLATGPTLITP